MRYEQLDLDLWASTKPTSKLIDISNAAGNEIMNRSKGFPLQNGNNITYKGHIKNTGRTKERVCFLSPHLAVLLNEKTRVVYGDPLGLAIVTGLPYSISSAEFSRFGLLPSDIERVESF